MEVKEKIDYWLDISCYDMDTADSMQRSGRYLYTVFMCQQAIEKLLKTLYLLKTGKEAPFSHNLVYLQSLLNLTPNESYLELMAELTTYYLEGRYPTYKQKLSSLITQDRAADILRKAKEIFQWLKSLLT